MAENRFYLDAPLKEGSLVRLEGEEAHHLHRVMRRNEGDLVEIVNGRHQLAIAQVTQIEKRAVHLKLQEVNTTPPPPFQIILAQALLRPKNLDLVIEKGTELGATAFYLFPGERSEKQTLSSTQKERLRHLSISALKQCGRLDLPQILEKPPLTAWEKPEGTLLYGDLSSTSPLPSPTGDTLIFIGPEKGLSSAEEKILSNTFKASGIRLNSNILRAETAAICSLSLIASK